MDISVAQRLNRVFRREGFFQSSAAGETVELTINASSIISSFHLVDPKDVKGIVDALFSLPPDNILSPSRGLDFYMTLDFVPCKKSKSHAIRSVEGSTDGVRLHFASEASPSDLYCCAERQPCDGPSLITFQTVAHRYTVWQDFDWMEFARPSER